MLSSLSATSTQGTIVDNVELNVNISHGVIILRANITRQEPSN